MKLTKAGERRRPNHPARPGKPASLALADFKSFKSEVKASVVVVEGEKITCGSFYVCCFTSYENYLGR